METTQTLKGIFLLSGNLFAYSELHKRKSFTSKIISREQNRKFRFQLFFS